MCNVIMESKRDLKATRGMNERKEANFKRNFLYLQMIIT